MANLHILITFYRFKVRCVIRQWCQTGANNHHFPIMLKHSKRQKQLCRWLKTDCKQSNCYQCEFLEAITSQNKHFGKTDPDRDIRQWLHQQGLCQVKKKKVQSWLRVQDAVFKLFLKKHKKTSKAEHFRCNGWPRRLSAGVEKYIILVFFQNPKTDLWDQEISVYYTADRKICG